MHKLVRERLTRAIRLIAPGRLEEAQTNAVSSEEDDVLIRVTHSAICGTDVKIFSGAIPVRYPRIMGHELCGEVVEVGSSLQPTIGQRVLINPATFCGNCFHCRRGQTNLCPEGKLLGRDADGGFADYLWVPRRNVHPLPDSIANSSAPVLQVLATCIHAQRLVPIPIGCSVAVVGLGVSGQLHAQLAKSRGASLVVGNSRSLFRREIASKSGVQTTISFNDLVASALSETSGRGVDLVIDTTGESAALEIAIEMCRAGGNILLFGINSYRHADIPFYQLYYKELCLISARSAKSEDFDAAVEAVHSGLVNVDSLITHHFPLEELQRALLEMEAEGDRLKVVLNH